MLHLIIVIYHSYASILCNSTCGVPPIIALQKPALFRGEVANLISDLLERIPSLRFSQLGVPIVVSSGFGTTGLRDTASPSSKTCRCVLVENVASESAAAPLSHTISMFRFQQLFIAAITCAATNTTSHAVRHNRQQLRSESGSPASVRVAITGIECAA